MDEVLLPLAAAGSGLAAGGLMISVLGGAPLLEELPTDQYVPIHKFLVTRFDPFMPISLMTGLVANLGVVAAGSDRRSRTFAAAGAALLASTLTVSLTKNVPINRWLATLDPDDLPEGFEQLDPRPRWTRWNKVRCGFAVAGLIATVGAVGARL